MQVTVTGHHVEVTHALREYVIEKMQRLSRHLDHVMNVTVVLSVEKHLKLADATVHAAGKSLFANSTDPDMYAAIDDLVDKLDKQVRRYKDRLRDHQVSREDRQASLG